MKTLPALGLTAALALALPSQALAQDEADALHIKAVRAAQSFGVQAVLAAMRGRAEITYEAITVEPRTGDVLITGLEIRPRLEWDEARDCRIEAGRVLLAGGADPTAGRIDIFAEIDNLTLPAACLEPQQAVMLQSFGYPTLEAEAATLTLGYHMPSSGAELRLSTSVADAAEVSVAAEFDYLGLEVKDDDDEEPDPVAKLRTAEVVYEDAGLWARVQPLIGVQIGDISAAPQMIRALLTSALAEGGGSLTPETTAFVDNVVAEVDRFLRDGDRLVLSLAPEGGLWLEDGLFQTPQTAIAALSPRLSAAPLAAERIVAPALISGALEGSEDFPDAERLRVGRALMTGVGAPRAEAAASTLLTPLAEDWDAEAAALLADHALRDGEGRTAYRMAMRAAAGGAEGGLALLDRAETELTVSTMLSAQDAAFGTWPGAAGWSDRVAEAEQAADISALRRLAGEARTGRGMPRSYAEAYRLAALAAAAGDAGAAILRDRIDARLATPEGTPDPAWVPARTDINAAVVEAWTNGGFGARAMRRYGLAE